MLAPTQRSTAFDVVPGNLPGAQDSPSPGGPPSGASPAASIDEQTKRMLAMIAQAAQQKKFAGAPHPSPVPGMKDPNAARNIGMNTANPHAWGTQRFLAGLQTMIQNGVAKQKETQMLKAEGDWEYLQAALNEQYGAEASGDQKAMAAAKAKVDAVAGDPKKLRNMAKALNQDWLSPEKTTVYGEALKRVQTKTQQTDAQKSQAKQGLMGLFHKLIQRQQQPQLTQDERSRMAAEISAKAPTTSGPDIKVLAEQEKILHDRAQEAKANKQEEAAKGYRRAALEIQKTRLAQQEKEHQSQQENAKGNLQERTRHDRAMENRKTREPGGDLTPAQKLARQKTINQYEREKDEGLRKAETEIRKRYGLTGMAATEAWPQEATDDLLSEKKRVQEEYETKLSNLGENVTHFDYSSRGSSQNGAGVKLDRSNQEHRRIAKQILDEAGGDAEKARKIARQRNFKF
jgi:hypothetical protein